MVVAHKSQSLDTSRKTSAVCAYGASCSGTVRRTASRIAALASMGHARRGGELLPLSP